MMTTTYGPDAAAGGHSAEPPDGIRGDGSPEQEPYILGDLDIASVYRQSKPTWMRIARRMTQSQGDAEDLVAEAFTRTLEVMQRRGEPIENLPGYVTRVMQTIQWKTWERRDRITIEATDLDEVFGGRPTPSAAGEPEAVGATLAIREAISTLPPAWREVLWYTEVEGLKPADLSEHFRMSAGSVSMLAWRARQGLRTAYLAAELLPGPKAECATYSEDIAAQAIGALRPRALARLEGHLARCPACRDRVSQAGAALRELDAFIVPALGAIGLAGVSAGVKTGVLGGAVGLKAWATGAAALLVIGGGVTWYVLSRPPAEEPVVASPATVAVLAPLSASPTPPPMSPTPRPTPTEAQLSLAPAIDPEPEPVTPALEPTREAPEPTVAATAAPVEVTGLLASVDNRTTSVDGRVVISVGELSATDVLDVTLVLPEGAVVVGTQGWTCDGGPTPRCQAQGASNGDFEVILGSTTGAPVDGTVSLTAVVVRDPTHRLEAVVDTPVSVPAL